MRNRGKLIRTLLIVAGAGAVAAVIARRAKGSAASPELPADVRSAIDEGVAAGRNGTYAAPPEPQWIPVAAAAADGAQEPAAESGIAASA
jgi:hypothetical protein